MNYYTTRQEQFNIVQFLGIDQSQNKLLTKANSFADMLNVYVNEDKVLSSRPKLVLEKKYSKLIKSSYFVKDKLLLVFVDNTILYNDIEVLNQNNIILNDKIICFELSGNIFIIPNYTFNYLDTKDKNYYKLNKVDPYIPTTLVGKSELTTGIMNESLNLLTNEYYENWLWDGTYSVDTTNFSKDTVRGEFIDETYTDTTLNTIFTDFILVQITTNGQLLKRLENRLWQLYKWSGNSYDVPQLLIPPDTYNTDSTLNFIAKTSDDFNIVLWATDTGLWLKARNNYYKLDTFNMTDNRMVFTTTKHITIDENANNITCQTLEYKPNGYSNFKFKTYHWNVLTQQFDTIIYSNFGYIDNEVRTDNSKFHYVGFSCIDNNRIFVAVVMPSFTRQISSGIDIDPFSQPTLVQGFYLSTDNGTTFVLINPETFPIVKNKYYTLLEKIRHSINHKNICFIEYLASNTIIIFEDLNILYNITLPSYASNLNSVDITNDLILIGRNGQNNNVYINLQLEIISISVFKQKTNINDVLSPSISIVYYDNQENLIWLHNCVIAQLLNQYVAKFIIRFNDINSYIKYKLTTLENDELTKILFSSDNAYIYSDRYWLSAKNYTFTSQIDDITYFPKMFYKHFVHDTTVEGFNLVADGKLFIYTDNGYYEVYQDIIADLITFKYIKGKSNIGSISKYATINNIKEIPLHVSNTGIYAIVLTSNIQSTERNVIRISNNILDKFNSEINKENLISIKFLDLTMFIFSNGNIYILDINNEWYYWELNINISYAYINNDKLYLISNDSVIYFESDYNLSNYYDLNNIEIKWYLKTQPLSFNNLHKQLEYISFIIANPIEQSSEFNLEIIALPKNNGLKRKLIKTNIKNLVPLKYRIFIDSFNNIQLKLSNNNFNGFNLTELSLIYKTRRL